MSYKRHINFEVLRSVAAYMVICIHSTIYYWKDYEPDTLEFSAFSVFNCFGRCAVPIFFMLSGAFMLQHKIDIKYILKKAGKLALIYLVWSALYAISEMGSEALHFQISQWWHNFVNEKFHLWFLPVLICIYLILPVLRPFVNYEDGRYVGYMVILFLVFGICKNTLVVLSPDNTYLCTILGKASVELCEYTGYFLLGYYLLILNKQKVHPALAGCVYIVTVLFSITITQIVSIQEKQLVNVFNSYFTLPVFIEAVSLFVMFKELRIDWDKHRLASKVFTYTSGAGLGIYLLHPFIMEHMDSICGINAKMCTPALALLIVTLLSFIISWILIILMKKIPIVRKLC